ncbi:MAG TPA: class A beta-lactamase [Dyella sp.]|uniref:class A beta-lactamase n=1 Tax=Dyella sp. TaxID=1869338 RepID=UPI002F9493AE
MAPPRLLATLLLVCLMLTGLPARAQDTVQLQLDRMAQRVKPATLGVAVLDLSDGRHWQVNADRGYPMMSVFKAPLGALVLSKVERGELSLEQTVVLTRADLRHGRSPIADAFRGESASFSLRELLRLAVSESDNTAADVLLRAVGGPGELTGFLRAHGIAGIRSDRGEGEIYNDTLGLSADGTTPAGETKADAAKRIRRGVAAYMSDPRDTATPVAAVMFLQKLWTGQLLSKDGTKQLLALMTHTSPVRIEAGLAEGATFAHKGGTSGTFDGMTPAYNDIGVVRFADGRVVIVAAFLTGSRWPEERRKGLFVELGRVLGSDLSR